jgi:hypothetical protein
MMDNYSGHVCYGGQSDGCYAGHGSGHLMFEWFFCHENNNTQTIYL